MAKRIAKVQTVKVVMSKAQAAELGKAVFGASASLRKACASIAEQYEVFPTLSAYAEAREAFVKAAMDAGASKSYALALVGARHANLSALRPADAGGRGGKREGSGRKRKASSPAVAAGRTRKNVAIPEHALVIEEGTEIDAIKALRKLGIAWERIVAVTTAVSRRDVQYIERLASEWRDASRQHAAK
jgi:hypothetical protein